MNTLEIERYLKSNCATRKYFRGVYSIDNIPKKIYKKTPFCMIVNTDPSFLPGTHWLACWVEKTPKCSEFFDSFGRSPNYDEILKLFRNYSNCVIFNNHQLQSDFSEICGQFCLLYLLFKCEMWSMRKFVSIFSKVDKIKNDSNVEKLFQKYYSQCRLSKSKSCVKRGAVQKCCSINDKKIVNKLKNVL